MAHKQGFSSFSIESAILRELGEQLVSNTEVALTELIKNAYDADATSCEVFWTPKRIQIIDSGHGMSFSDFSNRWMRIATGNKGSQRTSKIYGRKLTGSKGIGRFAVRFLGHKLLLISVSKNPTTNKKTKIIAFFNWKRLDSFNDLSELMVRYRLYEDVNDPLGTSLIISDLRHFPDSQTLKKVKSDALRMVSPLKAFIEDAPPHILDYLQTQTSSNNSKKQKDPGFNLEFSSPILPKEQENKSFSNNFERNPEMLAQQVLELAIARVRFETKRMENNDFSQVEITVEYQLKGKCFKEKYSIENKMGCDIYGDICYFPQRGGVFAHKEVNGKIARQWVKDNSGVAVYDKGFRITPYGNEEDDWLNLDRDSNHSSRRWRTKKMEELFPITSEELLRPDLNPVLALPENHQVVGAVFVDASNTRTTGKDEALTPNMDRQGFVKNEGFIQLSELTRLAVELIAKFDRKFRLEEEEKQKKENFERAQDDIDKTLQIIQQSPQLSTVDKQRLIKQYSQLREDYVRLKEHDAESRENLITMGLLGVVAGFMTHEYKSTLHELESARDRIYFLSKQDPELEYHAKKISESIESFNGYIDYTQAFISGTHAYKNAPYRALGQINAIINTFGKFRSERKIKVDTSNIDRETLGPNIPISMYRGILHNLYSNALKALTNHHPSDHEKLIKIEAFNQNNKHIIRFMDNGPGIAPGIRTLIWDPLFTTTSNENNPLGSGMGLGLSMVKRIIEMKKGDIKLIEPPKNFSTCFLVELPIRKEPVQ